MMLTLNLTTKTIQIMTSEQLQTEIIRNGVRNLKEFGYPKVNEENILTDIVYAGFFKSMLEKNRGQGVDREINAILEKMKP